MARNPITATCTAEELIKYLAEAPNKTRCYVNMGDKRYRVNAAVVALGESNDEEGRKANTVWIDVFNDPLPQDEDGVDIVEP